MEYSCDSKQMAVLVGETLERATNVKTIVCDNATNHKLIKSLLLGSPTGLSAQQVQALPFWRRLSYVDFPPGLPRFPFRKPQVAGETLLLERCQQVFFPSCQVITQSKLIYAF